MATLLSSKKSSYGSPYAYYTVTATEKSRTPTKVVLTVKVTAWLENSTSYLGTGDGMGLVAGLYSGGEWHEFTLKSENTKWSGTTKHTVTKDITVDQGASVGSITPSFRVQRSDSGKTASSLKSTTCKTMSITDVAEEHADATLSAIVDSQEMIVATLKGLKMADYKRVIMWYRGSTYLSATTVNANAIASEYTGKFVNLLPSTTYTLKAVIRSGSTTGTILATKTISKTTPAETGALNLIAYPTYANVRISGMYPSPSYTRNIEVYYKKATEDTYKLWKTLSTQTASISTNITGLSPLTKYDIKAVIKNGSTSLKTLTSSLTTRENVDLVPMPIIENIIQTIGTLDCSIEWTTDQQTAGTTYTVQYKASDSDTWTDADVLSEVISPHVVVSGLEDQYVDFRILAACPSVSDNVNESEVFTLYVLGSFEWDYPKTAGSPFIITADEWNRLADYIEAKSPAIGVDIAVLTRVRTGDPITADIFNEYKNAIEVFTTTGVIDKRSGDSFTGAEIDALRIAVNE